MPDAVFDAGLVERAAQAVAKTRFKAGREVAEHNQEVAEAVLVVVAPRLHAAGYEQARQKFAVPTMLYNEGHAAGKAEGAAEATRTHRAAVEALPTSGPVTMLAVTETRTLSALAFKAEVLRVIGGDDA